MLHEFRFAASRFAGTRISDVAAWLRGELVAASEEAEIGDQAPDGGGSVLWYDLGGDRYGIRVEPDGADWLLTIEGSAPNFVRQHETGARRQMRFDALVAMLRTVIVAEPSARLKAESGD